MWRKGATNAFRPGWLRFIGHRSALLGAILIGLVWISVNFFLENERSSAEAGAIQNSANLAGAFEQHLSRSISQIDHSLKIVRAQYVRHRDDFDLKGWLKSTELFNQEILQVSIVDSNGYIKLTNVDGIDPSEVNLADREHIRIHVNSRSDQLFISKPVIGRTTRKWSIQLTRRIDNENGSFGGVITASLDPDYLTQIYNAVGIGDHGYIRVTGLDGIVRASSGPNLSIVGKDLSGADLFRHYPGKLNGWYYTASSFSDNIPRLIIFRAVKDYPLIITIGRSQYEILSRLSVEERIAYSLALALTLAISAVTILSIRGHLFREKASQRLERTNMLLHATLANMPHGVCMFGADKRLVIANDLYGAMYGLTSDQVRPGSTLLEIRQARIAAGSSPAETGQHIEDRVVDTFLPGPDSIINELRDGRVVAISRRSMPDGGSVAIHQDITEQNNLERALLERTVELDESNARFTAALQNMSQGLCMFDADHKIVVVNERFRQIYDLPDRLMQPGTTVSEILEYRAAAGCLRGLTPEEYIKAHMEDPTEIQELGNGRIVLIVRRRLSDGSWLTTHEDITERRRHETRVAFMALHDALTGLLNRAALVEKITDACARHRRFDEAFSVFLLDLDRFKQVNDTLGHHAGDDLLKQVADRLRSSLRETDVLARLGGDEFAIIQTGERNPRDAAISLASRIIELVAKPFTIEGSEVTIGTSIGIALAPEHGTKPEDLLKMADLALYRTKARGRNDYTFFESAFGEAATARHALESDLRRAIAHNEFEVLYQPIADTRTMRICGAEALVRWRDPQKGLIQPDQFIPFAEETGLINQIGEWVLQAACAEAVKWPSSTKVAVNISAVQLRSASLLDLVMCVLVQTGLPPERLELEITETALIENGADGLSILRQFKNLGVTIALDDFGTGYSSLSQLTMFPFDKIKIDKTFTQNMTKRADCAAVISAVLAIANSLDITTTAEGVETKEQLRLLSMAGVSSVQGYLIKRPGPAAEIDFDSTFDRQGVENAA